MREFNFWNYLQPHVGLGQFILTFFVTLDVLKFVQNYLSTKSL